MIMRWRHTFLAGAAGISLMLLPAAPAQQPQQQPASIQGHANTEVGLPVQNGEVRLTQDTTTAPDKRKYLYTFKVDANGDYKGSGIKPGTYLVNLFSGDTSVDFQENQTFKPGEDKTENFDMSRPEYIAKESPERRKEIEELRAKNAAAMAGNAQIKNLNATILAIHADLKSPTPNYDKDVADSKAAVDARPTEPILWVLYGDTLADKTKAAEAADRKSNTNPDQDDAVTQGNSQAIAAYQKAADLMAADPKKTTPDMQATVYNELGNAEASAGKLPEAAAAYDKAIAVQPQNAGMFYGNEAAVYFNAHQDQAALDAANKAIAADPTKPLPYYIKGQELIGKSTVDPKTNKIVAPPGCVEAYQKYLELDPDGPQAPAVRDALTALGEKIQTRYSAGRKH